VNQPTSTNNGWTVTINEDSLGSSVKWSVTAYAICATAAP